MKRTAGVLQILIGIAVLTISLALFLGIGARFKAETFSFLNVHRSDDTYSEVKTLTVTENIDTISIEWINGNVRFLPSEDDAITVVQESSRGLREKDLFVSSISQGSLLIKDPRQRRWGINLSWPSSSTLTVYAPQKLYDSLSIETVSGKISGESLLATALLATSVSGDISLSGDFQDVSIDNVSGKISLHNEVEGDVSIQSVSGKITTSGKLRTGNIQSVSGNIHQESTTMPKDIDVESVSGNITLVLPENDGFSLRFEKLLGSFNSDFSTTKNNNSYVYGTGSVDIRIDLLSGSLSIEKGQLIERS